ncbi:MAG: acyl-[acyl-carrier-protein] thioesterase [Anaerolineales bacterium]
MTNVYTWRFKVRTYELDAFGHVNNVNYVHYMEEAATQASTAAGYDWDWYMAQRRIWVVRKWTVRYIQAAEYGDELAIHTWISDLRRVRSHREFDIRRTRDDAPIVRARADWVFVNLDTLRPTRIMGDFRAAFNLPEDQTLDDLNVRIRKPQPIADCHSYTTTHMVHLHEVDIAQHVNNAHYLHWIDYAYQAACARAGWPLERQMQELAFGILAAGHEIEYFKPARLGDRVRIESRVVEGARVRGAWIHEIYNDATDELLARDYAVGAFVDLSGESPRPTRVPQVFMQAILSGGG